MKILAGMVTYNRCGVVRTAIEALLNQTSRPDDIVIIDNMSPDSTGAIVAGYASRNVHYYRTRANLGGAGGFALLMEIFLAGDWDMLLLCDDDGVAHPDMLAELLKATDRLDIINALAVASGNEDLLAFDFMPKWPLVRLPSRLSSVADVASYAKGDIAHRIAGPFNGTLIKRSVLKAVGSVNPRMFIWGDEMDFIIRAYSQGVRIGTVLAARVHHPRCVTTTRRVPFVGGVHIPARPRALISWRNAGVLDRRIGKKLRGFVWAIRTTIVLLLAREPALAFKMLPYYADGYFNFFWLPPNGRKQMTAFHADRSTAIALLVPRAGADNIKLAA